MPLSGLKLVHRPQKDRHCLPAPDPAHSASSAAENPLLCAQQGANAMKQAGKAASGSLLSRTRKASSCSSSGFNIENGSLPAGTCAGCPASRKGWGAAKCWARAKFVRDCRQGRRQARQAGRRRYPLFLAVSYKFFIFFIVFVNLVIFRARGSLGAVFCLFSGACFPGVFDFFKFFLARILYYIGMRKYCSV